MKTVPAAIKANATGAVAIAWPHTIFIIAIHHVIICRNMCWASAASRIDGSWCALAHRSLCIAPCVSRTKMKDIYYTAMPIFFAAATVSPAPRYYDDILCIYKFDGRVSKVCAQHSTQLCLPFHSDLFCSPNVVALLFPFLLVAQTNKPTIV